MSIADMLPRRTRSEKLMHTRALSILTHSGVTTVEQLRALTDKQLLSFPPVHEWNRARIGPAMLRYIRAALATKPGGGM